VVLALGVTISVSVVPPELHEYVFAPEAMSVSDPPSQMVDIIADAVIVGKGLTFTVTVAVFTQLFASVPVTV